MVSQLEIQVIVILIAFERVNLTLHNGHVLNLFR